MGLVLRRRRVRRASRSNVAARADTEVFVMAYSGEFSTANSPISAELGEIPGEAFPRLTPDMMARIAPFGRRDHFDGGEYLYEVGDREVDFFIILNGSVDVFESDGHGGHATVATHQDNQFTGELHHLSGRAVLVCAQTTASTSVIRLSRVSLLRLVNAEPDIGETILRALILRRCDQRPRDIRSRRRPCPIHQACRRQRGRGVSRGSLDPRLAGEQSGEPQNRGPIGGV
jgi:CRP-like cAMP-binding protein